MRRLIASPKTSGEEPLEEINFKVHKFTPRQKPAPKDVVIFSCFSEFGTELLGSLYCVPILLNWLRGKYSIVMGWHGRGFLYKHLVDEYWEMNEEHMWLRKYCQAFNHNSRNLAKVEQKAAKEGSIINADYLGTVVVYPHLNSCPQCQKAVKQMPGSQLCRGCKAQYWPVGLFNDPNAKKKAVWPLVNPEKKIKAATYLKPKSVGITARNRSCYGRNLPPVFYERLIYQLEDMGYNPVWLGERSTTHPCPFSRIPDFTSGDDLESTLALVSNLEFTIQFWTASTRLAGLVGTPYILFESPDQILGGAGSEGQEGMRLNLCSRGPGKLVLCHYNDVAKDHTGALGLVRKAVSDVESRDYSQIMGMVDQGYWGSLTWKT